MDAIEKICRIVCDAEGVDPDKLGYGLGVSMPKGSTYPLWQTRTKIAEKLIQECPDLKKLSSET